MNPPNFSIPCNPRHLKYFFYFFKMFGVSTMTYSESPCLLFMSSKYGILYNIFLILFSIGISGYSLKLALFGNVGDRIKLEKIVDFVQTGFNLLTAIIILTVYCIRQGEAIKLANKINSVSAISRSLDSKNTKLQGIRNVVIINVLTLIPWILTIPTSPEIVFLYFVPVTFYNFIINTLFLQYSVMLKLIHHIFEVINNSLKQMFDFPTFLHEIQPNKRCCDNDFWMKSKKLSQLWRLCVTVSQLSKELSSFYSLLIFVCIPNIFITLIVYGYYALKPFVMLNTGIPTNVAIHSATQYVFTAVTLIILTRSASAVVNEVIDNFCIALFDVI